MKKDFNRVWENCLKVIKDNIGDHNFKTWFTPIVPIKLDNNVLTIQVPSQFFYEWLEEHYVTLLRKTIKKELGPEGRLEYSIVMDNSFNKKSPYTIKIPTSTRKGLNHQKISMPININKGASKEIPNPFIIPGLKKIKVNSQLIQSYTFDNFLEADCNRLARSAGLSVADNPGKTPFNPLLIYSNVGLGKTHLVNAIGIKIKNKFYDKIVLYVSAEQFINQYIDSIKSNSLNDFIHFYQIIDVLIVDDIQFLAGKIKTQDIFFHIFNHLHGNNKQIIITSDKPPVEVVGIQARLLSRFKWGLTADLQKPDFETRIAILQKKLYNDGIEIPDEVVEYIAKSINTNIRELEGVLISIIAQSSLNKKTINLSLAKQVIEKFIKNTSKEISINCITKVVCDYFNMPLDVINSKTRKRQVVQVRQLAMYFSKKYTKASLAEIGLHCGNKDHSTVLHSCRTVNDLIETDKIFRNYVYELDKKIRM